jgi:ribonuclease Y
MTVEIILASILFAIVGVIAGYMVKNNQVQKDIKEKESKGNDIVEKAKKYADEIKYKSRQEAKEIAREEKERSDREIANRTNEIKNQEREMVKKEATLDRKNEELEKEAKGLKEKEIEFGVGKKLHEEEVLRLKKKQNEFSDKLAEVAQMTKEEAKIELTRVMEEEARVDFGKILRRLEEETKEEAEAKSKRIVGIAIQRFAGEYVGEKTIGSVELPSDDVKGRLIEEKVETFVLSSKFAGSI